MRIVLTVLMIFISASTARAFCFEQAGKEYDISPQLLWAIAKNESSFRSHAINYNTNGTFDYGVMQINSGWYKKLGHERWVRLDDPCYNVRMGAWILSRCVRKHGYTWEAVACYNTPNKEKGKIYIYKIYKEIAKLAFNQK